VCSLHDKVKEYTSGRLKIRTHKHTLAQEIQICFLTWFYMKYRYQNPHPSLAGYIRTVLTLEGFTPADDHRVPLFTNGIPALYCRTEKDAQGNENVIQLTLFGQTTINECWTITKNSTVVAYFFKPFALATLFNIPVTKLMKVPVDLHRWNAHKITALRTQLVYASSTMQKVNVLDHLLLDQLKENAQTCEIIQFATDHMMQNSGPEILSAMLEKMDIHPRTFQRIFKKYVGITPTHYRRICQFQLSFSQLRGGEFETLTDVAYNNGFADQSHFIRSFREHTDTTPKDYLKTGLRKKK
jgi:AraC-like DNA-binding protein